jgi:hypothetical protein
LGLTKWANVGSYFRPHSLRSIGRRTEIKEGKPEIASKLIATV